MKVPEECSGAIGAAIEASSDKFSSPRLADGFVDSTSKGDAYPPCDAKFSKESTAAVDSASKALSNECPSLGNNKKRVQGDKVEHPARGDQVSREEVKLFFESAMLLNKTIEIHVRELDKLLGLGSHDIRVCYKQVLKHFNAVVHLRTSEHQNFESLYPSLFDDDASRSEFSEGIQVEAGKWYTNWAAQEVHDPSSAQPAETESSIAEEPSPLGNILPRALFRGESSVDEMSEESICSDSSTPLSNSSPDSARESGSASSPGSWSSGMSSMSKNESLDKSGDHSSEPGLETGNGDGCKEKNTTKSGGSDANGDNPHPSPNGGNEPSGAAQSPSSMADKETKGSDDTEDPRGEVSESEKTDKDSTCNHNEDAGDDTNQPPTDGLGEDQPEPNDDTGLRSNDNEQYDVLIGRADRVISRGWITVSKTTLLARVHDIFRSIFDPCQQKLSNIPILGCTLVSLFSSLTKANKALAERDYVKTGNQLALVEEFGPARSYASMLLACDPAFVPATVQEERPEVTNYILQLKAAKHRYENGDDSAEIDFEGVISDDVLKDFVQVGYPAKKLLAHTLHFVIMHSLLSDTTVYEAYEHLGKREEYIENARKLTRRVNPQVALDDSNTTMLEYLERFALPGLEVDGTLELAERVICQLFGSLTSLRSQERNKKIISKYKAAESRTFAGSKEEGCTYFCAGGSLGRQRRMRMVRSLQVMLLKKSIKRRFPPDFFSCHGFTRSILRASPTHISEGFAFVNEKIFVDGTNTVDDKVIKRLKAKVVDKKLNSNDNENGERMIIIESREQINCLRRLLSLPLDTRI